MNDPELSWRQAFIDGGPPGRLGSGRRWHSYGDPGHQRSLEHSEHVALR